MPQERRKGQKKPPHRPPNRQLPKASTASAVGALFPEDRHVGRHGGRLPLEQVAIPGWVARGGVGLGGGRLEAVAGRRLAWSLPLAMMYCLDTRGAFRGRRRSRTEALPRAAFFDRAPHLRCSLSRSRRPFLRMMPWPARQRVRWHCTLLGKSGPFACHGFSARALACSTEPSRGTAQPGHRPLDRLARWSGQAGPSPALPR